MTLMWWQLMYCFSLTGSFSVVRTFKRVPRGMPTFANCWLVQAWLHEVFGCPSCQQLGILVINRFAGDFWQSDAQHLNSISGAVACESLRNCED